MKVVYALAWTVLAGVSCLAENLVPGGDFTQAKKDTVGSWCRREDGKFSLFNEDLTWNNCLKLEVDVIRPVRGKFHTRSAVVAIGGADGVFGFPVKPDTVYEYSIDLKGGPGAAKTAGIDAMAFTGEDYWRDRVRAKMMTPSGGLVLGPDWKAFRGKFRTPSGAKRVSMRVSLWSTDEYAGMSLLPDGAFVLIDNVRVEESRNNLGASPADVRVERKKAVAVGDEFSDFLSLSDGAPAADEERTTVRVRSATADGIVLDVICKEPDGIVRGDGRSPWSDDNVEIWFGATAEGRVSSQFAVGASGATACALNGEPAEASLFSAKTKVSDGQWGARVTIPPSALGLKSAPPEGTFLPFNVGRQRRGKRRYLTWNRLGASFSDTGRFGTLVAGSYAAGLKCRFGADGTCAGREAFETAVAEAEAAALKARLAKFASSKLSVAPVPVTDDFSVPYLPEEIFDPPDEIRLTAAVNEMKPLPLAVANLTDRVEDYVVRLETDEKGFVGRRGLAGFPSGQVVFRTAMRVRDAQGESPTLRFDVLPRAGDVLSLTVAPREAGLAWIDFDTRNVKPGTYRGRLRVIPTCESGVLGKGNRYAGGMKTVPVTLEVLPVELPEVPKYPSGFYSDMPGEDSYALAADLGLQFPLVSVWSFPFKRRNGGFDMSDPESRCTNAVAYLRSLRTWAKAHGDRPVRPHVAYQAGRALTHVYGFAEKDVERLWPEYVKGLDRVLASAGFAPSDYVIETYDEPQPERFEEVLSRHRAAKEAVPGVRLQITLGCSQWKVADLERLGEVTDEWVVWDSFFKNPELASLFRRLQRRGAKIYHYTCSMSLREPTDGYYRRKTWFTAFWGLDGTYMWKFSNANSGVGAEDFMTVGEGGFVRYMYGTAMPTLRYMAFREGVTDFQYVAAFEKAAGGDAGARTFVEKIVRDVMTTGQYDRRSPDRARAEILREILKRIRKGN